MMLPVVSIILPIRNEANHIERTLTSVSKQTYPPDRLEVIVVDGQSDDSTQEKVLSFAAQNSGMPIVLLNNLRRVMPSGFNQGLAQAHGEIIIMIGGHCELAPDYVMNCANCLAMNSAEGVGGVMTAVGETNMARAIANAQSSRFGVGGVAFRMSQPQGAYVDTVAFGAYRRSVFDRIGVLDEELIRNQDDELNFRLTQAGGKIWLDPSIRSIYHSRSSIRKLWKQYYQYGVYKVRVIQKRGAVPSWRHLAPSAFVTALVLGLFLFVAGRKRIGLIPLVAYAMANSVASLQLATKDLRNLPYYPIIFATLHISYGLGFLVGLWKWRQHGFPSLWVA